MRRIVLIATAVTMLVAASVAYAAFNSYTGKITFTTKAPGAVAKPATLGYTENLSAKSTTPGNRAAVLTNITTKLYGLREDGKDFPTCSAKTIDAAPKFDTACPKGSMVAHGFISAAVGPQSDFSASQGAPCDPLLHVYNAGQGKLEFFFVDQGTHQCAGGAIPTGAVKAYPGTYKVQGKYLVVNVPIPSYVSYPVHGLAGSLQSEHLVWAKQAHKGHPSIATVGCMGKKRPYSNTFTSNSNGKTEKSTVKGTAACS